MERWLRDGPECDDAGWGEPNVAAPGGKSGPEIDMRSTRRGTNITMATESTNVWLKKGNFNKNNKKKCFSCTKSSWPVR